VEQLIISRQNRFIVKQKIIYVKRCASLTLFAHSCFAPVFLFVCLHSFSFRYTMWWWNNLRIKFWYLTSNCTTTLVKWSDCGDLHESGTTTIAEGVVVDWASVKISSTHWKCIENFRAMISIRTANCILTYGVGSEEALAPSPVKKTFNKCEYKRYEMEKHWKFQCVPLNFMCPVDWTVSYAEQRSGSRRRSKDVCESQLVRQQACRPFPLYSV